MTSEKKSGILETVSISFSSFRRIVSQDDEEGEEVVCLQTLVHSKPELAQVRVEKVPSQRLLQKPIA